MPSRSTADRARPLGAFAPATGLSGCKEGWTGENSRLLPCCARAPHPRSIARQRAADEQALIALIAGEECWNHVTLSRNEFIACRAWTPVYVAAIALQEFLELLELEQKHL